VELLFATARPGPDLVDVLDELETLIEDVGSGWVGPAVRVPEGLYVFIDLPPDVEEALRDQIVSALSDALAAEATDASHLPRLDPGTSVPVPDAQRERLERAYPGMRVLSADTGFEDPLDVADELADLWDRGPDRQLVFLHDCLMLEGGDVYAAIIDAAFGDRVGVAGFCHQWARGAQLSPAAPSH
jgi:hypothetical protein